MSIRKRFSFDNNIVSAVGTPLNHLNEYSILVNNIECNNDNIVITGTTRIGSIIIKCKSENIDSIPRINDVISSDYFNGDYKVYNEWAKIPTAMCSDNERCDISIEFND